MLPDSLEAKNIRNQLFAALRDDKIKYEIQARKDAGGSMLKMGSITTDASHNSFYNMVIVKAELKDCYEVVNILNYFGFPHEVEEEEWRG